MNAGDTTAAREESEARSVVDVVTRRLDSAPTPREGHDDGATIALVIEGGGMRGIVSAAMTCTLEQLGILDVLDLVVGTSSGAVNAAAAVGGVITGFAASYAEVFSAREFIDVRRLASRRPVVDSARIVAHLDRLFDLGATPDRPGSLRLAVVATDVGAAEARPLTDFTDRGDRLDAIHASGLLPLLGGPPMLLRGRRWLDGGIVEPVPVHSARRLGATHAIVLTTRPGGSSPTFGPADRVIHRYLTQLNPDLAASYRQRPDRYLDTMGQIASGSVDGMATLLLTPHADSVLPSRLDRDAGRLRAADRFSRSDALHQLRAHGLVR